MKSGRKFRTMRILAEHTESVQVKLQVKKFDAIVDNARCFAVRTPELVDYLMAASSRGGAGLQSAGPSAADPKLDPL